MRGNVRISDLILWQWRPSIIGTRYWYDWQDAKTVASMKRTLQKKGLRGLPPIRVSHSNPIGEGPEYVMKVPKGKTIYIHDGFHRVYAARALGYKTIRAYWVD